MFKLKANKFNEIFYAGSFFFPTKETILNVFKNVLSLNKKLESEEHQKKSTSLEHKNTCSDNTSNIINNMVFVSETFVGRIWQKPTTAG